MFKNDDKFMAKIINCLKLDPDILELETFNFLIVNDADSIGAEILKLQEDSRELFAYELYLYYSKNKINITADQIIQLYNKYTVSDIDYLNNKIQWKSNFKKII